MACKRLFAGSLLAASLAARVAAGQEHSASEADEPGPRRSLVSAPNRLPPVDYDAPNPDRDLLDYVRALANVAFVNWTIWQISWARQTDWTPVDRRSLEKNLSAGFEFDQDALQTNFLGHPYHGGLLFNSARGAGLGFWESVPYAVGGSLTWEYFAEREKPSINDMASTALGGIMLGEISYRLSSGVLDDSDSGSGRLLRELAAFVLNPMRGFNRFYTSEAWHAGPPPIRKPARFELDLGIEHVRVWDHELTDVYRPSLLVAGEAEYGDLLPTSSRDTLEPFDYFDLYASATLLHDQVAGAVIYAEGIVYAFSVDVSDDTRLRRDNDVFGFAMTYDYQGANVATYGSVGFGPVNYLVLRYGRRRTLKLGTGFDVVPVLGARSALRADEERTYNFATGVAGWAHFAFDYDRLSLGLRTRYYLTRVVDGSEGNEIIGSARGWIEAGLPRGIGVGFAPSVVNWQGLYENQPDRSGYQLGLSAYLKATY